MQHIKILYFSFSNMHPRLDGHEFEQDLGVDEGQRSLVCYSPWGYKELDITKTEQ